MAGTPVTLTGWVVATDCTPLADAKVEIWQADDEGLYDVQRPELEEPQGRGHLYSADDGRFWFWTVRPEAYPIPSDGPVGALLAAAASVDAEPGNLVVRRATLEDVFLELTGRALRD